MQFLGRPTKKDGKSKSGLGSVECAWKQGEPTAVRSLFCIFCCHQAHDDRTDPSFHAVSVLVLELLHRSLCTHNYNSIRLLSSIVLRLSTHTPLVVACTTKSRSICISGPTFPRLAWCNPRLSPIAWPANVQSSVILEAEAQILKGGCNMRADCRTSRSSNVFQRSGKRAFQGRQIQGG